LDDHETFRREFAAMDDTDEPERLREVWESLAALLDLHAAAEEAIFYPQLLRRGDNAEDETVGAIGDHNDIRDRVHKAAQYPVGRAQWWDAVRKARVANSEHMAEEEDDALADFRRNAPASLALIIASESGWSSGWLKRIVADRHQAVPPGALLRGGFSMAAARGMHSLDHPAHHIEIVGGEVDPTLAQDVQYLLTSGRACLVGEALRSRARRVGAQPVGKLPG
jgi:Hemerythrin HHE cation binding domain